VRTFVRNSLSRVASQGAGKVSLFLWTTILARALNPAGFGAYVYIAAVTGIIGIVSDYGLGNLTTRDVARRPSEAESYFAHSMALRMLLALGAYALLLGAVFALPGFREVKGAAVLFGLTVFTVSAVGGFNAILNAREELQWSSFMNAMVPMLTLAAGFAFLGLGWGLTGAAAASVAAGILVLCAERALFQSKRIHLRRTLDYGFMRTLLRKGFPFFLVSILSTVNVSLDSVLLEALRGKEAVGMYNASFRLILALMMLPAAIGDAVFPVWSRESGESKGSRPLALGSILWLLFGSGILVAAALAAAAPGLIRFVFGPAYLPAVPVLRIHSCALVFMYLSAPLMIRLFTANRLKSLNLSLGTVVAASALANLILIPRLGFLGAAWARLSTEALNFLLLGFFVRRAEQNGRREGARTAARDAGFSQAPQWTP